MTKAKYRITIFIAQILVVSGLGIVALWNIISLLFNLPSLGWWSIAFPIPGLCLWGGGLVWPHLMAYNTRSYPLSYRLVYATASEWEDSQARTALLNLAISLKGIDIMWVCDGPGVGCWLAIPADEAVLKRLVETVFPSGQLEAEPLPTPTAGVVILKWQKKRPLPAPDLLCTMEGIEGVYFRWKTAEIATVGIWGAKAKEIALQFARQGDLLASVGESLKKPPFSSQNPWPSLPPFPPSHLNPGLEAVSHFQNIDPVLRVEYPALTVGIDREGYPLGFELPDLTQTRTVWAVGERATDVVSNLAHQAYQAGYSIYVLDGQGAVIANLRGLLMRELASEELLLCDLDRPAQSQIKLNPLWLPAEEEKWPEVVKAWQKWFRNLGVTVAGLGLDAYRHTLIAVTILAMAAIERKLLLDPPSLRDTLETPELLNRIDQSKVAPLIHPDIWNWWLMAGKKTAGFDVQLRLGHLRDRLSILLERPEYRVLWQAPYCDPQEILETDRSLLWKMTDGKGSRQSYISSQLLALLTMLQSYKKDKPILIFINELPLDDWAVYLREIKKARLVIAGRELKSLPQAPRPQTLIASRVAKEDAEELAPHLPGTRPADLRRLPLGRLIFRQGKHLSTVDRG